MQVRWPHGRQPDETQGGARPLQPVFWQVVSAVLLSFSFFNNSSFFRAISGSDRSRAVSFRSFSYSLDISPLSGTRFAIFSPILWRVFLL